MAGIKRVLDPSLYPHESAFVMEHLRFSLFAPAVAELVRLSHLSVAAVLLLLHVASIWVTLYAAWLLCGDVLRAARGARRRGVAAGGMAGVTCGRDIAGADGPVCNGSQPVDSLCRCWRCWGTLQSALGMTAVERRRGILLCCAALAVAGLFHPLMAAYALGSVLVLRCLLVPHRPLPG